MSLCDHARRRRASILLAGAVALSLTGCDLEGEGASPSSSSTSQVPLETTSTTEPSTATTTAAGATPSGTRPATPGPETLIDAMRSYASASSSVTITGTLHDAERDLQMSIVSEGSTGGVTQQNADGGKSHSTVTLEGGGKLESVVIGMEHYVKVDKAWLDTRGVRRASPMRKRVGQWVQIPRERSAVEIFKPYRLIKSSFFGEGLTPIDARYSPASTVALDGEWVHLVQLNRVSGSQGSNAGQRQVYMTTGSPTKLLEMTYGRFPDRTTLKFSKWGSTDEDYTRPAGAKSVKELDDGDL